ncbi:MAG: stage II sporulation protein P [Clostridiales bacterium]|nr:stage II sporulation protein P [Clostridiales bacterium]
MRKIIFITLLALIIASIMWLGTQDNFVAGPDIGSQDPIDAFEDYEQPLIAPFFPTFATVSQVVTWEDKLQFLYNIDETAFVYQNLLDIQEYAARDLTVDLKSDGPKVLILHTHSQESFADSRPGEEADTVVGLGNLLASILANEYQVSVIHDVGKYDVVNGKTRRDGSYERMNAGVSKIIEKYPSIEVTIDLHRDAGIGGTRFVTDINGQPTARMMFFNGVTCLNKNGDPELMPELPNPYLRDNLALSLQLQLISNEFYPGLMRQIYIKPYRYSLHLRPRSMLVEVGADTNTATEARNAMRPLAEILVAVLGKSD